MMLGPVAEGYQLDVTPKGIDLRAGSSDGLFYGMQTLRQLYSGGEVPCVSIQDNPRFGYRGLHLDVSRHFFSKEEVMKLLDVMSFLQAEYPTYASDRCRRMAY